MAKTTLVPLLVATVVLMVGCDHATKRLAEDHLQGGQPVVLVSGALELRYAENPGVAFSLMRDLPQSIRVPLLVGLQCVGLAVLLLYWWRFPRPERWCHLGFALAVAGAIGNVADRVALGHVVDFIHLHHWPIFNVADILLAVGFGLVLLAHVRPRTPATPSSP